FNYTPTATSYTLSLHDALPIWQGLRLTVDEVVHHDEVLGAVRADIGDCCVQRGLAAGDQHPGDDRGVEHRTDEGEPLSAEMGRRSEEHTSELQSRSDLVCRLLL